MAMTSFIFVNEIENYSQEEISYYMPQQVKRLLLVFAALAVLFIGLRFFLVPPSFGKYGHYRADSIEDNKKIEPMYAHPGECENCHGDVAKIKAASRHASVACQACHGPSLSHIGDPAAVKPDKPHGREFCALCHAKNFARSKDVPQVNLEEHNRGMDCFLCHKPHNPKIK